MNLEKYQKDIEFLKKLGYFEQYKNSNIWETKWIVAETSLPILEYNFQGDHWRVRRSNEFPFTEATEPGLVILKAYDLAIEIAEKKAKYMNDGRKALLELLPTKEEETNELV